MKLLWTVSCFLVLMIVDCHSYLVFPLKMSSAMAKERWRLIPVNVPQRQEGGGLSLALEPGAQINFLAMVDNLQGDSGRGYYLEMLIGTPPQKLNILVDTGSSNFAVAGAPDPDITTYFDTTKSSTYRALDIDVSVQYSQGSWEGVLGMDVIAVHKGLAGNITINIATILESEDFFLPGINWQGILGLAYNTLSKPSSTIETFFDSLVRQEKIPNIFSLQMCGVGQPVAGSGTNRGSLVLGGIEPSLYTGEIWYTPIKEEWYYQVEVLKLEVGGRNLNLDCTMYNADKAIVDSGTTLLRLPQKVFDAVVNAIIHLSLIQDFTDGFWTGSQLACWDKTETPWPYFPDLSIYLRDINTSRSFRLTIQPQMYLQPMLTMYESWKCYRFGISPSSNALVIGAIVMEGFYVIFDRAEKRVGFAVSSCSDLLKAVALLLASTCAWYLGYLFAENLPDDTLTVAINNIQSIAEKPVIQAPPPRRQKCDHWTACPAGSYAFRLVSGGGNVKLPKICFEDELLIGEKKGNAGRGLNIAIVDYGTGKVVNTKKFDTYEHEVSGEVVKCLKEAPEKAIILIATHDEAANKLREEAKKALMDLGSKEIRNLGFRSSWIFLALKGGKLPSNLEQEKINHSDDSKNRYSGWPAEIQIDGCIPKP